MSPRSKRRARFEEPNRVVERRRTEMHVTLRRSQVLVAGEFLNRARRRTLHREVRTERVPQAVRPAHWNASESSGSSDMVRDHVHLQGRSIRLQEDALSLQMPVVSQRRRQACGERDIP
jgi:hypothetical protein